MAFYDQAEFVVRFGWGERGVLALAAHSDVVVIVDVLSFATAVDVAVGRGAIVFPFGRRDEAAEAFAQEQQAELAGFGRRYSLAPASMLALAPGERIVLPSPNGSTLTTLAGEGVVLTGCLRNYQAVAQFAQTAGVSVAVIAAGERWWPQQDLRPALEDMIGAGAIISALGGSMSPEAQAAAAVFRQAQPDLQATLLACASGKELVEKGLAASVHLAAELGCSTAVPLLQNGAYVNGAT
ncbi:MAG: 2-phosphosulfolactate phosphatase [Anaerolineales bacterium]|nr:2-phosphosulfolactate phosphatase [Anaerolineales bacterium]